MTRNFGQTFPTLKDSDIMSHIVVFSSAAAAFVGGRAGEKRCQIIDILHRMTDERTGGGTGGSLQSPRVDPISAAQYQGGRIKALFSRTWY